MYASLNTGAIVGILLLVAIVASITWVPQRDSRFPSASLLPVTVPSNQAN